MTLQPTDILEFWFEGDASERRKKWFDKNPEFDAECGRFTAAVREARAGHFDHWAATSMGGVALIILLDQLPRNLFRGSPEAFAADPHALRIARAMLAGGLDLGLTAMQRMFVYLPFEHSETIADQNDSVRLFESLRDVPGFVPTDHAERHRLVIREFGRFPHRNAALGRVTTPEEAVYLATPGAGF